ncbi:hypothetical protein GHT06_014224 [Daphnia sinensis]|uniref:Uncharacterized protein n=1 Tax=Daphnia sinensis TaxID=1820382 RepID=A0AAD5LE24_9CRUS|nr:hypothetical protein GHT06_014224 [Daphnia sinensis]
MFKKLKDKIAEEVKQSPLRLPTSVQQHLSQYSPFTRDAQNGDVTETHQNLNSLGNGESAFKRTQEVI